MVSCYRCCTRLFAEASSGRAALIQESPSRPQIPTVPWQTIKVHTQLLSEAPSMNKSAEQLPREIFADVQSFLRSLSKAQKENLWLFCQMLISSFLLCGSFGQYVTGTTLFSPYREQVGIFLPPNFGIW